jgi:hypothetical protein
MEDSSLTLALVPAPCRQRNLRVGIFVAACLAF